MHVIFRHSLRWDWLCYFSFSAEKRGETRVHDDFLQRFAQSFNYPSIDSCNQALKLWTEAA